MSTEKDDLKAYILDPENLPKHFDAGEAEVRWDDFWQSEGIHKWEPSRPRDETFVVDTPPPTASGSLHPGHVFSYTHTDILVRFQRMIGKNIYYPMGWDDNGLPTERRVQNYYHVRCDPTAPYEDQLELAPASAKMRKKPPKKISRDNFIELCHRVTTEDEKTFMALWKRLGVSVDWNEQYQTIDDNCRRIAQFSFLDLLEKNQVFSSNAPSMWDVDFQCAIAQAEVEDRNIAGAYHDIEFGLSDTGETFTISTTRPELLPACVGITAHPSDERYKHFFGREAISPLFRIPVPIFPSEIADPEKGTGILMVCTFGDATDVEWWRDEGLTLRQLVGRDGRLLPADFGSQTFPSLDPVEAERNYSKLKGKTLKAAKELIVALLREDSSGFDGTRAALAGEPRLLEHSVKFFEKGDRPLEFVPTRQWFVRLLDKKKELIAKGNLIKWHPDHMRRRYEDWTENLSFDWCVSRQRFFGVPIPVWYPILENGNCDYKSPLVPMKENLPTDPTRDCPPGFTEEQRNQPGGFKAETDIFDTWFTSSLTPQISSHWGSNQERHQALFPADVRPQAHDIIRTWAFYTIAKAHLHEDSVPWKHATISGWILDPDRKKMSKSKGNVVTPIPLIDKYSADGVRYWAGSARLGVDTALDEKVFKIGKRLVTKVFNASKFVLTQDGHSVQPSSELDLAFLSELRSLVRRSTKSFEDFDQAHALMEIENFFWSRFTDTYIELVKVRARSINTENPQDQGSAIFSLRFGLSVLLRLLAPFLPFVTEEVWSWAYAEESGFKSIHISSWPKDVEFAHLETPNETTSLSIAIAALTAINKAKADGEVSMGRALESLVLSGQASDVDKLRSVAVDVTAAARCENYEITIDDTIEKGSFQVKNIEFAPKPT